MKAKFSILLAFSELNVACFADIADFSPDFKAIAQEMIDHIAQERKVKVVLFSFHAHYSEDEIVEWCSMEGYNEFAALFKGAILNEKASVKVIDSQALYERINLNRFIESTLDETPLKGQYKTNNHLVDIQVWWKDGESFGELRIYSQEGYHVGINHKKDNIVKVDNLNDLRTLISDIAHKRGAYENIA